MKKGWKEVGLLRSIQLTITGCLGPCELTNVISILTPQKQIWLGKVSKHSKYEALLEWGKASAEVSYLLDLPELFHSHVFERFKN